MRRLLALAALLAAAPTVRAQFDPIGIRKWNETSPTGHLVTASLTGTSGGFLGGTTVMFVCLLRDVGNSVAGTSGASCLKTPFVIAGAAAGQAFGLLSAPSSRYKGSVLGGTVTGTAALAGIYFLYLEPRLNDESASNDELQSYVDAAVLIAVGTAGTALGYRYGPGGRWHDVTVAPATGAAGSVGMRLAVRF